MHRPANSFTHYSDEDLLTLYHQLTNTIHRRNHSRLTLDDRHAVAAELRRRGLTDQLAR